MKKIVSVCLVLCMLAALLAACGTKPATSAEKKVLKTEA